MKKKNRVGAAQTISEKQEKSEGSIKGEVTKSEGKVAALTESTNEILRVDADESSDEEKEFCQKHY